MKSTNSKRQAVITAAETEIQTNKIQYNIPVPATVMIREDGITTVTNPATGVGVKGAGFLLGILKPLAHRNFQWTWGWMIRDFGSPVANKATIFDYMKAELPGAKLALNVGSANVNSPETERFLNAVCVKAYGLKYIVEFGGSGGESYVIGMTTLEPLVLDDKMRDRLANTMKLVEAKETDPVTLANADMTRLKLGTRDTPVAASVIIDEINSLKTAPQDHPLPAKAEHL